MSYADEVALAHRYGQLRARIAIAGAPRAGKTELAARLAAELGIVAQHIGIRAAIAASVWPPRPLIPLEARAASLAIVLGEPWLERKHKVIDWSAIVAEHARHLLAPGPYVVEGSAVMRALRAALTLTPDAPCDRLIWMPVPREPVTDLWRRMFEVDEKRLAEFEPELKRRGVEIVRDELYEQVSDGGPT